MKIKGIDAPILRIAIQVCLNGKIIYDMPMRLSHSWNRNAYILWIRHLGNTTSADGTFGEGYWTGKAVNTSLAIPTSFNWDGTLGSAATGIVVGTGTTAEDPTHYALATAVAHGNGAGQLYYNAGEAIDQSFAGGTVTMSRSRYFNNNSGASIVINEVGVYASYMVCRDKLSASVTVPDTGQLKVTYEVSFDCSP